MAVAAAIAVAAAVDRSSEKN